MAFIIDREVLKTGLVILRRGDVERRNFFCRVKLPVDIATIATPINPYSATKLYRRPSRVCLGFPMRRWRT
jgi:hypothetical protein